VVVVGTNAYVSASGVDVYDITNPENPEWVATALTPGSAYELTISGSFAYVADGGSGLQVVDISDPANPHMVGGRAIEGSATDVVVVGGNVFASASGSGLQVLHAQCGEATAVPGGSAVPAALALKLTPNPTSGKVSISWTADKGGSATARIYDLAGRLVRRIAAEDNATGGVGLEWDGRDESGAAAPAGVYLVRLETADGVVRSQKMALVK
jgi:hypothetical protein